MFASIWGNYNHFSPLYTTFLYISTPYYIFLLIFQRKLKKRGNFTYNSSFN